ncbi:MAG: hypothetical protein HKN04_12480 [Rhodothermaceae bacterium]|nr:hypothetical protein [Rhodothermaceae bacterium]
MRSILFIALGALAAFVASLLGTYVLMPIVAPAVVEAERLSADSLAADSLAADSALVADSLKLTEAPAAPSVPGDSIGVLRQRLAQYEAQIGALQTEIGATKAQRAQASDLVTTLIKLEDRELSSVLARLDFDVLALLYAEASARDRARLLGALEPSRTALFVRRVTSASVRADVPS